MRRAVFVRLSLSRFAPVRFSLVNPASAEREIYVYEDPQRAREIVTRGT